jgi:hypothetical protein
MCLFPYHHANGKRRALLFATLISSVSISWRWLPAGVRTSPQRSRSTPFHAAPPHPWYASREASPNINVAVGPKVIAQRRSKKWKLSDVVAAAEIRNFVFRDIDVMLFFSHVRLVYPLAQAVSLSEQSKDRKMNLRCQDKPGKGNLNVIQSSHAIARWSSLGAARKALHIEEGGYIEVRVSQDSLIFTPMKLADKSLAYFWSPEWQAAEREVGDDIASGRVREFGKKKDRANKWPCLSYPSSDF